MRVSSSQYHITVNASLQTSNSQLEKLMSQMASGNRLLRPSDDPISHVRIARLDREEANIAQYLSNIGALSSRMSHSETVMTSMSDDLWSARDLLVWALDGANTHADLKAMATNFEALRDSIMASSLSKDQEGNYMFSGTQTKAATVVAIPLLDVDGKAVLDGAGKPVSTYKEQGNDKQQMVVVGNGLSQPANVSVGVETAAVLNALSEAIVAIRTPGVTANDADTRAKLTAALDAVDNTTESIATKIAQLGGSQNIIATLENSARNISTANQISALDYAQLDYASAATQLNSLMTAVQATQNAYGKVSQLSLFNAL